MERPVSRRTWGAIARRPRWMGRAQVPAGAGLGSGFAPREVYGPPLDGWPFEGGERIYARLSLAIRGVGGERWRGYSPPFGEVDW